jgi:hypothetical protein
MINRLLEKLNAEGRDALRLAHFNLQRCATVVLASMSCVAVASPTTVDLWRDMGLSASLLGGGTAHVSDSSASDRNPAGIVRGQVYATTGEMGWIGQKSRQAEFSVCDPTRAYSELIACVKVRQTQKITGATDRRYTLALADVFTGGLILGVAGDYVEFAQERKPFAISAPAKSGFRLRGGFIYALQEGISVGARSDGLFDATNTPRNHAAGVSAQIGRHFLVNGDLYFDADAMREALVGVSVLPRDFLDFAVSYGYAPKDGYHRIGGGLVVRSQQARLSYTVVRSSVAPTQLFHTVGIGIFFVGEAGPG